MTAVSTYHQYTFNIQRSLEQISQKPEVGREAEYYKENISNIKSIEDFVADRRIYAFAMKAYGLEDMTYAKAFMRKILEGGTDDPEALSNRLTDPRYREFAEDFNFVRYEETTTTFTRVQTGVIDRYHQQVLEQEAGAQSNGARLALYFQRKAEGIDSPYALMGDSALLEVIKVGLGLPTEISFLPIEKQAAMITARMDIEDLKDPAFVDELLERFTVLWDLKNPQSISVPSILPSNSVFQTISQSVLATLQNIKLHY